jgi:hypothetical protein
MEAGALQRRVDAVGACGVRAVYEHGPRPPPSPESRRDESGDVLTVVGSVVEVVVEEHQVEPLAPERRHRLPVVRDDGDGR